MKLYAILNFSTEPIANGNVHDWFSGKIDVIFFMPAAFHESHKYAILPPILSRMICYSQKQKRRSILRI